MEEQLISTANLDAIEGNLNYVAKELSGVISNVSTVNEQINGIEENISALNNELSDLVREIRETTIVNNARQSIMYNNEQIEKKYGYFDTVRRKTESLLQAIDTSNLGKKSLLKTREELLLNNPNYWLSNAMMALISWIIDDKENTEKELHNAMSKNREKTCAFFCLINLKLNRVNTAINWLNNYLNNEDPTNLSNDFITILDLVSNNEFGNIGKKIIIDKINGWFNRLSGNVNIKNECINEWIKYIKSREDNYIALPYLEVLSKESNVLRNNLKITSSYRPVLTELKYITEKKYNNKPLDEIINNLIYEYEKEEQAFAKDNFKNQLIIDNDGNREKALEIYENEKTVYQENVNICSLLNNIVIFNDKYKVNDETRKLALSLIKGNILDAYKRINSEINQNNYSMEVEDFKIEVNEDVSTKYVERKIDEYIEKKYQIDDSREFIILAIFNLLLIASIILSLKVIWAVIVLSIILIVFDIYYSYMKIYKKSKLLNKQKESTKKSIMITLERGIAESIDYKNKLDNNNKDYDSLRAFLDSIDTKNYIRSNDERSIDIDE